MKKQQTTSASQDGGTGMKFILGIVVFLFIIGLIVFIFALMSGEIQTATAGTGTGSFLNQSITLTNGTGSTTSASGLSGVVMSVSGVTVCS
jgi:hypothetical protein